MKHIIPPLSVLRAHASCEPDDVQVFRRLLFSMEYFGDFEAHRTFYLELLDRVPYACLPWYNLGIACQRLGRHEEALEAYEYAWLCQTEFSDAYLAYARLAMETGFVTQALGCLDEMAKYTDLGHEALLLSGDCFVLLGQTEMACKKFRAALKRVPTSAEACHRLGQIYRRAGKMTAALRWLKTAAALAPATSRYLIDLAECYAVASRNRLAERYYWQAIACAPEDPTAWQGLIALQRRGANATVARATLAAAAAHLPREVLAVLD